MKIILTILFSIISLAIFSQVKIPIVKVYNHSLTGNENALIDNQAAYPSAPTGANSWWNDIPTYLVNPVLITIDNGFSGAFRTSALPKDGINFTLRFNGNYQITKVAIYVEPKNSGDKGHAIIRSGTPYNWSDTLIDVHDNGSLGSNAWFEATVNDTSRWINLSITSKDFGIIREVVCFGNLIGSTDADTWTIAQAPAATNILVDTCVGMNIYYGMGQDFDGTTKYDEGWNGGTRTFAAAKYVMDSVGNLYHQSGAANSLEASFMQRVTSSGGNQYYCYGSLVTKDMAEDKGSAGDWANQKPIDIALGDVGGGQRYNSLLTFNEIAELPASYARAAFNLVRLARGNHLYGAKIVETDNEKDGSFKGAGFMFPEQLACMMSVYWDGHNGTVTYNDSVVGLRNYPALNDMQILSPAFSYISPRYFDCMKLWFDTKRAGFAKGLYPFDVLSVHAYPGTFEVQFSGAGEAVHPENVNVYNLQQKMQIARNYAYAMGKSWANTESGFDTYKKIHPHPEAGCGAVEWGGSFVAIKNESEQPPYNIQAKWLLRDYLLHIAYGAPLRMYWLADQAKLDYGCGTFNAAGLLEWSDDHGIGVPTYLKKPSYYYIKTLQNRLSGYKFLSQTISLDSLYTQLFVSNTDTSLKAKVVWFGTYKDKSDLTNLGSYASYNAITMNNTETGSSTTGTGALNLVVDETPKIILYTNEAQPPAAPCNILRTRLKFVNAP